MVHNLRSLLSFLADPAVQAPAATPPGFSKTSYNPLAHVSCSLGVLAVQCTCGRLSALGLGMHVAMGLIILHLCGFLAAGLLLIQGRATRSGRHGVAGSAGGSKGQLCGALLTASVRGQQPASCWHRQQSVEHGCGLEQARGNQLGRSCNGGSVQRRRGAAFALS